MILIILITVYQYYLANPSKLDLFQDKSLAFEIAIKSFYILFSIGISFGLIYGALNLMGAFNQDASKPDNLLSIIFNLLLFTIMLSIIYKLANVGGFLDKNPYYRLVIDTFFYLPCLLGKLVGFFQSGTVFGKTEPPKPFEVKMLVLSLVLLALYFLWNFFIYPFIQTKYLTQGGKQLINQPISTNTLTNVISYQKLLNSDAFNYRYAMSFWFYLDSFPQSTNASYNNLVDLLSYGKNPSIKYSSQNNTLYITVKQSEEDNSNDNSASQTLDSNTISTFTETNKPSDITDAIEEIKTNNYQHEYDDTGNRIIFKQPNVKLQKWNQIILNYSGGTLDVFYNGKLVKSAIEVVPYLNYDMLTVGSEDGVSGYVGNLMYFNKPLDILTINTLYTSLKNKSPPAISSNKATIIPYIA